MISLVLLTFKGLNYGIDFKGGTLIELRSNNTEASSIRDVLKNMNLRKGVSVVFDVLCICILIWKENCYMFIIVIAMNYPNFSA